MTSRLRDPYSRESVMPGRAPAITELLASGEKSYSFEFFPPRTDEAEAKRHVPKVVRVDAQNRIIGDEPERPGPQMPLHHLHGEPQA